MVSLHDGKQAIARLADTGRPRPEVLLLDWRMPGRDGGDVLAWVRGQSHLERMGVIIVSGSTFDDDKRRATDLGADDYLLKPVNPEGYTALARQIEEFREGRRLQDSWRDRGAALSQSCWRGQGDTVQSRAMTTLSPAMPFPAPAQLAMQIDSLSGGSGIGRVLLDFMGTIAQTVANSIDPELAELHAVCRKHRLDPGLACGPSLDSGVVKKRHGVLEDLMAMNWDDPTIMKWFGVSKRTLVRLRSDRAKIVQIDGAKVA